MTTHELREAVDTYTELLRVHQLNLEMLDTLEITLYTVKDFCIAHNITIGNERIISLLSKVNALFNELDQSTDEKKHLFRTDEEVTEPQNRAC